MNIILDMQSVLLFVHSPPRLCGLVQQFVSDLCDTGEAALVQRERLGTGAAYVNTQQSSRRLDCSPTELLEFVDIAMQSMQPDRLTVQHLFMVSDHVILAQHSCS